MSQATVQNLLDIDSDQILLNSLDEFYFDNKTFVPKHYFAMIQILSTHHEHEFFWFGNNCESASYKPNAASYNSNFTCGSHIKGMSAFNLFTL